MKKTYINPALKVVKIQPAQVIATSLPTGDEYNGERILSRRARFSDWNEEDE